MSEQQPQQYEFKQLDKFTMYAPVPGVENRRARLQWSSYRGNPRISVFTGVPNDTGKGVINAAMNPETFLGFIERLKNLALSPKEDKEALQCYTMPRSADGQTADNNPQNKILNSTLMYGKDSEGIMWISVVAENRPRIKFEFALSDFHVFLNSAGQPVPKSTISCLQCLAVADALKSIFITHMAELRPSLVADTRKPDVKTTNIQFEDLNF